LKAIGFRAVADELSPFVVWSDQTLWSGMEDVPGGQVLNGNRWLRVAGIYPAGSGQLWASAEVQASGDWLMVDQLSSAGVIVSIRSHDQELPDVCLLPGMSIAVPGMVSFCVVAVPEQADLVECRVLIGSGSCPVSVGPRMPTGQPQPVVMQRRVSGPNESWAHFGGTQVFAAGTVTPSVVTLTSWQGRRFGGGRVYVAMPAYADVQFVVGPVQIPTIVGANWGISSAPAGVNSAGASGYALVGVTLNPTAAGSVERIQLDDDPGVYVGYPGTMALHAVLTNNGVNTATSCSISGAIRLRAEAE
jgi:hypothetical protein